MLARIASLFRRRPRRAAPRAGARPEAPAPAATTVTEMVRELVDQVGPPPEVDRERAATLASTIADYAVSVMAPRPFPVIAQQVIQLASRPESDLNAVVGVLQRDAAVAAAVLRVANSAAYAPASPVTSLRTAASLLGMSAVVEVVMSTAGADLYAASPRAQAVVPGMSEAMFEEALATAFTAGRLALDHPSARGERALLAGLLTDIGAPTALRALGDAVRDGLAPPPALIAATAIELAAPGLRDAVLARLELPAELRAACLPDRELRPLDAELAQLAAAIGAVQRASSRLWSYAADVRAIAERLALPPLVLRSYFGLRAQERLRARQMLAAT